MAPLLTLLLLAATAAAPAAAFVTDGCIPHKTVGKPADSEAEGRWLVLMGFSASNTVRAYCQKVTVKAGSRPGLIRIYWELSKKEEAEAEMVISGLPDNQEQTQENSDKELPAWLVKEKRVLAVSICKRDAPPHLLLLGRKPEYPLVVASRLGRAITGGRFRSGFLCTRTVHFT